VPHDSFPRSPEHLTSGRFGPGVLRGRDGSIRLECACWSLCVYSPLPCVSVQGAKRKEVSLVKLLGINDES
jgi:hypothetical protein